MLITFEGIDGSGKSTQIEKLGKRLENEGYKTWSLREPGGTRVSEEIRSILLKSDYDLNSITELFLFSAARSQLMTEKVLPLLKEGYIVILDRFYDSTTAYQGYGRQALDMKDIQGINQIASHRRSPDLTFYMKLSLEEAQQRTDRINPDRMEQEGKSFYERVIQGFNELAESRQRIVTIDATQPKDKVESEIWKHAKAYLQRI